MLVVSFFVTRGVELTTSHTLPSKPSKPILFLQIVSGWNNKSNKQQISLK